MSLDIGLFLFQERRRKDLSQGAVSSGICSVSVYSEYELGEKIPDFLTLSLLFERIGYHARGLTAYISKEEYAYWEWKEKCNQAMQDCRYEEVSKLLGSFNPANVKKLNKRLVDQYTVFLEGVVAETIENDYRKASEKYLEAYSMTIKNPDLKNCLAGITELKIYFCYLKSLLQYDNSKKGLVEEKAKAIIDYLDKQDIEEGLKVKILPLYVSLWCSFSSNEECFEKKFIMLQSCISLVISNKSLLCLTDLFEHMIEIGEELFYGMEKQKLLINQLENLYREFEVPALDTRFQSNQEIMIELIGDYLKKAREKNFYSQDELSEGICSVESYSRIENGRNPSRNNYKALTEKLEIEERSYYDLLRTGNLDAIRIRRKINTAYGKSDYGKMKEYLDELKKVLGSECTPNKQYLEYIEIKCKYGSKEISTEECYEALIGILSETIEYEDVLNEANTLTQLEIKILVFIGLIELQRGNSEKVRRLLEYIIDQREVEPTMDSFQYYDVRLAKLNLAKIMMDTGEEEKAKASFSSELCLGLRKNDAFNLEDYLCELAFLLLEEEKDKAQRLFEYAMTICELYKKKERLQIIKQFYDLNL